MARKRIIDTQELYFKADLVKALKDRGLHLYIRLWGIAEDWGGYEPDYESIALKMGALRFSGGEVEGFISLLLEKGKIIEYSVNGKKLHWLVNFMEHQVLNNPSLPKLPLPEWITFETHEFKSGRRYAKYSIIPDKLPVAYQYPTSTLPVKANRIETNRIEQKQKPPEITAFFSYFLLKTKKDFKLTQDKADLIKRRLKEGFTLDQLKLAVDNFILDDWPDRKNHLDLVYCIGKQKGKPDNLEKWLNCKSKPKGPVT